MTAYLCFFCFTSMILLNVITAKPLSEIQESLKELLEGETAGTVPFFSAEEAQVEAEGERDGGTVERRALGSWTGGDISAALVAKENAIDRLLGDILTVSKRSRFKKGGLRSCFGVRLERIGSFSGLGC